MVYTVSMEKKKIAVLTTGWSIDFINSLIKGLQKAVEGKNIDLYFFVPYKFTEPSGSSNVTGFAIFDLIDYKKFDGVIIIPNLFGDDDVVQREYKRILAAGVPAVSLIDRLEGFSYIYSETHTAFYEIVNHLIEEHKVQDFCFIGGPDGNLGAELDFAAYKKALTEHNISIPEDSLYLHGDWTYGFGYEQAKKIFSREKLPQAVVCVNDWAALAVMHVACEKGIRVPEDMIVTGFDQISIASLVMPSITSSDLSAEEIGIQAVKILLENSRQTIDVCIKAEPVYRQSCGCIKDISLEQRSYTQDYSFQSERNERFMSQMRHLEDLFIKYDNIYALLDNSQEFFVKRHAFEGPDFAILLKDEVVRSFMDTANEVSVSTTFGKKMKVIVNIQDGEPAPLGMISSSELIPENMKSEESTLYLFFPIFNQKYLHGYYVSKNFFSLLNNKSAYNWTRAVGSSLEKFRQKVSYRLMSEQLRELSTKDALSELMNRTGMNSFGVDLFNENNIKGIKTQVIFIDINSMKQINDKYGHLHGDLAVKTVALSIAAAIPPEYIAIRYGGDEFVIIGPANNYMDVSVCDLIIKELNRQSVKMSLPYKITVSMGAKTFSPNQKSSLLEAIKEVDDLMYVNKQKFHAEND